jgi:hypothetical protein
LDLLSISSSSLFKSLLNLISYILLYPKELATFVAKSSSSKLFPSNNILCLLTISPSLWCIYFFTTTFLFLLKNKSAGGISLVGIGVRSPMNITSALGFPLVNCNGVIASMGLSIFVDHFFPVPSVFDLSGEDSGLSSP